MKRRSMLLRRSLLVWSLVAGELLVLGARGTLAADSSQITNAHNAASSGTLTLETTAPETGPTICQSSGGGVGTPVSDHNTSCGTITVTAAPLFPGQTATTTIRIENSGSVDAGELSVYAPTCTSAASPSLCTAIELSIQQTTPGSPTPTSRCYYPVTTTTCSFASFSSAGGTGTLTGFRTKYPASTTRLRLPGGLQALSSRTFTLGFELPAFATPSVGNTYQGRTAKLTLTWYLTVTSTVT